MTENNAKQFILFIENAKNEFRQIVTEKIAVIDEEKTNKDNIFVYKITYHLLDDNDNKIGILIYRCKKFPNGRIVRESIHN